VTCGVRRRHPVKGGRDSCPAHRAGRARRFRGGRVRPSAALATRLWLVRRAGRGRLGPRPHRSRLGGADARSRLHPLRRPGRRQGAAVTDAIGAQAPEGLLGIHLNFLRQAVGSVIGLPADSEAERAALAALSTFRTSGSGYFMDQATRPQTIGYACWIRRSRWRPGCSTTTATTKSPAPLAAGSAALPPRHLFQRGRQRRPLPGLGGAATVFRRNPRGVPVAAPDDSPPGQ
jgi:hypothetical protein